MTFEDFKDIYQKAPALKKLNLLMETLSRRADAQAISATERWNGNWEAEQHWNNEMRVASAKARWLHEELTNVLKAQEPRILRLDELRGNDTAYIEINNLREPVLHCIIYYDKEADGMDVKPIKTNISSAYLRYSEHNRVWRPWTSQPSDAQREATPWQTK